MYCAMYYLCPITIGYDPGDYRISMSEFATLVKFSRAQRRKKNKERQKPSLTKYNDHILHPCPDDDGEWECSCMCSCCEEEKLPIFGTNGLHR